MSLRLSHHEKDRTNQDSSQGNLRDKQLNSLEEAASSRNARTFERIFSSIDWTARPTADFIFVINRALSIGAFEIATRASAIAKEHHPDDVEIGKYAYVLAPPKVTRRHRDPDPSIRANRDWLKNHSDQYYGKWVALRDGELLDADESFHGLIARIGDVKGVLVTTVF